MLVFVDWLTKMVQLAPVAKMVTAKVSVQFSLNYVFWLQGLSEVIATRASPAYSGYRYSGCSTLGCEYPLQHTLRRMGKLNASPAFLKTCFAATRLRATIGAPFCLWRNLR